MSAGDKELGKIFEETITRNVKAILDHGNETRRRMKTLEETIAKLGKTIDGQNATISLLQKQLSTVQSIVFRGGTP